MRKVLIFWIVTMFMRRLRLRLKRRSVFWSLMNRICSSMILKMIVRINQSFRINKHLLKFFHRNRQRNLSFPIEFLSLGSCRRKPTRIPTFRNSSSGYFSNIVAGAGKSASPTQFSTENWRNWPRSLGQEEETTLRWRTSSRFSRKSRRSKILENWIDGGCVNVLGPISRRRLSTTTTSGQGRTSWVIWTRSRCSVWGWGTIPWLRGSSRDEGLNKSEWFW